MTLLNFLDIGGFVCGVVGVVLVGNINRWGYALLLLCNIGYGGLGYIQGNWGLFAVSIFMGVLDIYYFIKWTKQTNLQDSLKRRQKRARALTENNFTQIDREVIRQRIHNIVKKA